LNSYQRVKAVLEGGRPDRTPRFEVWIDALHTELGVNDPLSAHPELGQDAVLLPSQSPPGSNAWKEGLDEFGRIWKKGMYFSGALKTSSDLKRYSPPPSSARQFFNEGQADRLLTRYPDHFPFFGTHAGPFMGTYMAMGMAEMFCRLTVDISFINAVMETRTDWCLALFKQAVALGAKLIIMGDDAAHRGGPLVSPQIWQQLVLPHHRRITTGLPVPVIWHSDGQMEKLLPFAVEAGFAGVHGLEPPAGNNLAAIKHRYDDRLILIGNVDVNLLCGTDLGAVQSDINRCLEQGGRSGFMLSTSNSIFRGMNPDAVRAYFEHPGPDNSSSS
jgi:uroporphyrinogen-III decarboxylase